MYGQILKHINLIKQYTNWFYRFFFLLAFPPPIPPPDEACDAIPPPS